MSKSLQLLLIENVDSLGIVGDVVTVRTGYARNFLLPRNLATKPDDKLIAQLAGKRAEAQRQLAALRKEREATTEKLRGVELELVRACNDQGILYGAVTQQDLAAALQAKGFKTVTPRDVRITQAIKRVDHFDVHVKLDKDLDALIKLHVKPDRELPKDQPTDEAKDAKGAEAKAGEATDAKAGEAKPGEAGAATKGDRPERGERRGGGERRDREDRFGKKRDVVGMALEEASKQAAVKGWGSAKSDAGSAGDAKADKAAKKDAKADGAKGEKKKK